MSNSYAEQLLEQRKTERKSARPWIECYMCQTPPTFENVKSHFAKKGMLVTKADYEAVCRSNCIEPQFESA